MKTLSIFAIGIFTILNIPNSAGADEMWISKIQQHGMSSFNTRSAEYKVYRNVMDFGCKADGVTDDTSCINAAISSGDRCGKDCGSSTVSPAIVYFPSGKYLISSPIIMYYYTQLVGNANNLPILVAAPSFQGIGVLDSDPYLPGGKQWYTNQNNFFRQVRNFIIDLTGTPSNAKSTGIHWQVAQATSLTNIIFKMSKAKGTAHQGIWMENGSGGFMADLTFEGGKFGMWVGNQQFLSRNLKFDGCQTAIYMNWNWQWTFKNVQIRNCQKGIEMNGKGDITATGVGSILLLDSIIENTPTGIVVVANENPSNDNSGTLLLDNVKTTNVKSTVVDTKGKVYLAGGSTTIKSWGRGSVYTDKSGKGGFKIGNLANSPNKTQSLLDSQGNFFERSRPQYEKSNVDDIANIRDYGAMGDGRTDDTKAIQEAINKNVNGKVVFFPAGSYIITNTVFVPPGTRMTGETWSVLMANGPTFASELKPTPMIQVGKPGDAGLVEISEFMFSVKGPAPGAILVQWNMRESAQGNCAMFDAHFRVGGTSGSDLQKAQCPKGQGYVPQCAGAFMLLHLTPQSSAYLENVWAWTADHDLDHAEHQGQISIYTGRGVLIESTQGPVWLYGTQSEHNVFYQYQLYGAKNVFMTMIQSETPYWQSGPPAPKPYAVNSKFNDPSYTHCKGKEKTCAMSWALRSVQSSNIYVYGAGLYNFFNNYNQQCLKTESCQDSMVQLDNNTGFYMYNLNTKAATNMVVGKDITILAKQTDNRNSFCQTINAFLVEAN